MHSAFDSLFRGFLGNVEKRAEIRCKVQMEDVSERGMEVLLDSDLAITIRPKNPNA